MSSIEEITGELHALAAGVERAQHLAAAADSQAQEITVRAAGAGFTAVAAGIARVRTALSTIQGGLGSLATAVGEAVKAAASVPRQATPQETIAGLTPVQQGIASAREITTATMTQVDNARQLVSAALHGGQPGPLLQSLDSIKQVLVLLVQRSGTAQRAVEAATNQARQLGSSGN
ncbi:hypothetical protein DER29_6350 [Micromonospora sp. M71_S20]|uniref:DUF6244 family protein n=1 Tax=Micromonospora sp. M71_S20 TaxID=592872 RepID=UPI000EB04F35|nr:DUF6244 family protein [Micromonospora sp. M71_S20]RLK09788.1 hypothetical protein DER29_6350 [Micromonospora sp. M71_S20]